MTPRKPRPREGETRPEALNTPDVRYANQGETRRTCMTPGILRPGDRFTIETFNIEGLPTEFTAQAVELTDDGMLIKLLPRESNA